MAAPTVGTIDDFVEAELRNMSPDQRHNMENEFDRLLTEMRVLHEKSIVLDEEFKKSFAETRETLDRLLGDLKPR